MQSNTDAFLENAIEQALAKAREDIETKIKRQVALNLSSAFSAMINTGIVDLDSVLRAMEKYGLVFSFAKETSEEETPSRPSASRFSRSSC